MRDQIVSEIKRLAAIDGGKAPGKIAFHRATGIKESQWCGVYWARWTDALAEAGLQGNTMQARLNSDEVLEHVATLTRELGKVPTIAELKLAKRSKPGFPSHNTVAAHSGGRGLAAALKQLAQSHSRYADLLPLLPADEPAAEPAPTLRPQEGWVYLLKSGAHFKIGRSDTLERRVKEVGIALPEAVTLVHAIKTDDPVGIEAYWHRRFADRRANGEWFRLDRADLAAFQRRKYQ